MKKTTSFPRSVLLTIVISFSIGSFCVTNVSAQPNHHKANFSNSCSPAFIKKAQHLIDQYRQNTGTPGMAVAFYDNGKSCILSSGTTGNSQQSPVTGETDFAMGSVEKVFSSTLLAFPLVENKAKLDDPAANYLIGKGGVTINNGVPFRKITLKELVTHTSALPRKVPNSKQRIGMNLFRDKPLETSIIQFLNSWHPDHKPGTKYVYSNLGFVLAGFAAVQLGGKSYTKLLAKEITGPLGMTHTGMLCDAPAQGCAVGYNENNAPSKRLPVGLWTTADDMLRFVEANLGDLKTSGDLSNALDKTHKVLFRVDNNHAIGMAWEEWHGGDSLLISKDGEDSGFSSWVGFEQNKDCGVVVLRNGGKKPSPAELGKKLLALAASMR